MVTPPRPRPSPQALANRQGLVGWGQFHDAQRLQPTRPAPYTRAHAEALSLATRGESLGVFVNVSVNVFVMGRRAAVRLYPLGNPIAGCHFF